MPATGRALAAVALEHTDIEPTLVEGATEAGAVSASIRFDGGQQLLRLGAQEGTDGKDDDPPCDERGTCAVISTDAGDVELYWEDEEPEEDPGIVVVTHQSDDGLTSAYYAGDAITGDPRELDLAVDVDEMVAIVTDERFGTSTTEELADADVPGWAEAPSGRTPQTIAAHLTLLHQTVHKTSAAEVDTGAYGDGSIGAVLELEDGITVTGYYVPDPVRADLCPTGWACETTPPGDVIEGHPRAQANDFPTEEPRRYRVVVFGADGSATIVDRDGPPLAGWDPRESMERVARSLGDVDLDAEDIAAIDAIWVP